MAFPDDLLTYDKASWQAVSLELKQIESLSSDARNDFIHYLRMAADYYKLNVHGERQGPAFKKEAVAHYEKKKKAEQAAQDLLFHLNSADIAGFIGDGKSQELMAQLKYFLGNSQASHPKSPPPPVGRGAAPTYSKYRLALSFAYLWDFCVGGKITEKGFSVAAAFFRAAGYRPKDRRCKDGEPSDMRKLLRTAHRLQTGKDPYLCRYLTPYILVGKLNVP